MPQGQKPLYLIHFCRIPFSNFHPLPLISFLPLSGVIRIGLLWEVGEKLETFWNKISLAGCQWSNLDATRSGTPVSHSPVVDVDVDPVPVSPEPDPDHAGVVRPAEHLLRWADPIEELLSLGDGRARRQEPAVAQNSLNVSDSGSLGKG